MVSRPRLRERVTYALKGDFACGGVPHVGNNNFDCLSLCFNVSKVTM
jgi:hypothetical protein